MEEAQVTLEPISPGTCVVRNTAARKGRAWALKPGPTASRHLHYGRVILGSSAAPVSFTTGDLETAFIALGGQAVVQARGGEYTLRPYDALYVPRDSGVTIAPGADGCDLAEVAAPVTRVHPVQFVSFRDVQADAGLHFAAGGPSAKRQLNVLVGKNVESERFIHSDTLPPERIARSRSPSLSKSIGATCETSFSRSSSSACSTIASAAARGLVAGSYCKIRTPAAPKTIRHW